MLCSGVIAMGLVFGIKSFFSVNILSALTLTTALAPAFPSVMTPPMDKNFMRVKGQVVRPETM